MIIHRLTISLNMKKMQQTWLESIVEEGDNLTLYEIFLFAVRHISYLIKIHIKKKSLNFYSNRFSKLMSNLLLPSKRSVNLEIDYRILILTGAPTFCLILKATLKKS